MKIRTHKYAAQAFDQISDIKNTAMEGEYRTLALTFPTMILQSGLMQAIGFLKAKDKPHHAKMLEHLEALMGISAGQTLHTKVLNSTVSEYQLLTRQALDASGWLKRYTQAELKKAGASGESI